MCVVSSFQSKLVANGEIVVKRTCLNEVVENDVEVIPLKEDILKGAKAIGNEINESERRTYYLCERGYIPAKKIGRLWVSSKSALRKHYLQYS